MHVFEGERIDDIGFGNLRLIQNTEDFCYGIDAVILADFAAKNARKARRIADLGTGTGILPLILSHKTDAEKITGFEVRKSSYEIAVRNAQGNGLEDRISFVNSNVKDIDKSYYGIFDTVTMNPPYMESGRGIVNPDDGKMVARHEILGTLEDFMKASSALLEHRGDLFVVHRPSRLADIFCTGRSLKLEPKAVKMVKPREGEAANIVLVHLVKNGGKQLKVLKDLIVYGRDNTYTDDIISIYERV